MALKATGVPEGATVTVEIIGGDHGPTTLDEDLNIVLRIKNTSQKIKITGTLNDKTYSKTYSLTGLTLGVSK